MNSKRHTILIADDEELNRELLKECFCEEFDIVEVENGKDAIEQLLNPQKSFCCVLLDLIMPYMNGYQVLQKLKALNILSTIPIVLITGMDDDQSEHRCYELGAQAFISKPFNIPNVKIQVENIIKTYNEINQQVEIINYQRRILENYNSKMLEMVANLIEERNGESGSHVKRVKTVTLILAMKYIDLFPEEKITETEAALISEASMLHDLGKIKIPDAILLKPGKLTYEEKQLMQSHCELGAKSLDNFFGAVQTEQQFALTKEICLNHHERYDGKGYPRGLMGNEIPFSARVVSVADCFDALVCDRCYRKAFSYEEAIKLMKEGKCGGQLDPKVMQCLDASIVDIIDFYNQVKETPVADNSCELR